MSSRGVRSVGFYLKLLLLVGLFGLSFGLAQVPGPFCYIVADTGGASGGNDLLLRAVRTTGIGEAVGTGLGTDNTEAIAFQPVTGLLYAANELGATGELGVIDTETGTFSAIGTFGMASGTVAGTAVTFEVTDVDGISFDTTGGNTLYGAVRLDSSNDPLGGTTNRPDLLIQIDPTTGAIVPGAFGGADFVEIEVQGGRLDIDDMAFEPVTGVLYGIANLGGNPPQKLVTIDTATGATVDLGDIGSRDLEGLGFGLDGRLYATDGSSDPSLYLVNTSGPAPLGTRIDTIGVGADHEGFSCFTAGEQFVDISGQVANDADDDGDFSAGDTALEGVRVELYSDPNGDGDFSDGILVDAVRTDASGAYSFIKIGPGDYVIVESDLPGFVSVRDTDGANDNRISVTIVYDPSDPPGDVTGNDFLDVIPDPDTDGDGIPDDEDIDDDNDGILDVDEGDGATDSDGDGVPDSRDIDSDDDGIPDVVEWQGGDPDSATPPSGVDANDDGLDDAFDTDLDGVPDSDISDLDEDGSPDHLDIDADNDGLTDLTEAFDADGDGAPDVTPTGSDSDSDGLDDAFDTVNNSSPDPVANPVGSNVPAPDTDGRGGPNQVDIDADDDGIPDNVEGQPTVGYIPPSGAGTDMTDADGDGLDDAYDADTGDVDPLASAGLTPVNTDGSDRVDYIDGDSDNDRLTDAVENGLEANAASGSDSDGDGLDDAFEGDEVDDPTDVNDGIDAPESDLPDTDGDVLEPGGDVDYRDRAAGTDTDGDGVPDVDDIDDDNDGILDVTEGDGATDSDGDGIPDSRDIDADDDGITDIEEAQEEGAYVPPSETDADGDGLDDAYDADTGSDDPAASAGLTPVNTDGADEPDYLDDDSDNDTVPDTTEGHDANHDGEPDTEPVGSDSDSDGLDDAYDTVVGPAEDNETGSNAPLQDTDDDGTRDWRDVDDDDDGIPSEDEDDNGNGDPTDDDSDEDGTPDYLDNDDADGDGVPDADDLDDDNDGIPDVVEGGGADPSADDDSDGVPNYVDPDTPGFVDDNGDGVDDRVDNDGDGVPNHLDLDSDNDGITDVTEAGGEDADGDGIIDDFSDADGDGLADSVDPDQGGTPLPVPDTDDDTAPDYLDLDSDDDGITDVNEAGGTDADGDGIIDGYSDADGDGLADSVDPDQGGTPLPIPDTDGDTRPNHLDIDSDDDGIVDNTEGQPEGAELPPSGVDTDGDGIDDRYDPDQGGTPVIPVNTDGTDEPDYLDLDTDNDTVPDPIEGHDANQDGIADTAPSGTDSDGDGLDDAYDTVVGPDPTGSNAPLQDTDEDGTRDWRDVDDDDDGTPTEDEDYNDNGDPTDDDLDDDGTPDYLDDDVPGDDSDGDGIPDIIENPDPDDPIDTDEDGNPDYLDIDADNDGITDNNEAGENPLVPVDNDGDGVPDYRDIDADDDGIPDNIEGQPTVGYVPPSGEDADDDGLDDAYDADTGDPDPFISEGVPPENTDGEDAPDYLDEDSDNDGSSDLDEGAQGTPTGSDTDGDGLDDGFDDVDGPDPNDDIADPATDLPDEDDDVGSGGDVDYRDDDGTTERDTDGDGVPDVDDIDDDNDGILDTVEGDGETDTDGDGIPDSLDIDADDDGIPDNVEAQPTVGYVPPTGSDADGDGLDDAYDDDASAGLTPVNTDGEDVPDYLDEDSDNDGASDLDEGAQGSPTGSDSDGDGLDDGFDDIPGPDPNDDIGDPVTDLPDDDGDVGEEGGDVDYRDASDTIIVTPTVQKDALPGEYGYGDAIPYTITVMNPSRDDLIVTATDFIPEGTAYIADSTVFDPEGAINETEPEIVDTENGISLVWDDIDVGPGETVTIRYELRVLPGAESPLVNRVEIRGVAGVQAENEAEVALELGAFGLDDGVIAGRVYIDRDRSGTFTSADAPLPGVRVILENGWQTTTDARGNYAFREVASGIWGVQIDHATAPYKPAPHAEALGNGYQHRVRVQGLSLSDFPLEPLSGFTEAERETTLIYGPVSLEKRLIPMPDGVRVSLFLTTTEAVDGLIIRDPQPDGSTKEFIIDLEDEETITYDLPPGSPLTDPEISREGEQ